MNNSSITNAGSILPIFLEAGSGPLPDISQVGGKGANLARLARAGLPVPEGFLVTTQAYRAFITANGLEAPILGALPAANPEDLTALEAASTRIRSLFTAGCMPEELSNELVLWYRRLGEPAVAVRSSATAEDLPDLSFAGQQDTYLNVVGSQAFLEAVVRCWSSLWTARAIAYRMRNGVSNQGVALAVVVQKMVESQASGVLFTANPLTGLRSESVIDATLGLGEALVSGQVEPDHSIVDMNRRQITERVLGAKGISIRGQAGGGTQVVQEAAKNQPAAKNQAALPDDQLLALADLGQRVAGMYAFPQDIEWAWAGGHLYLLQARPVTSLFPTPAGMPAEPLKVMFSFAAVQGMLDPVTPIGRDALRTIFATAARLFRVRVTAETQQVLFVAGERLWINITALVRNSVGRRLVQFALGLVEPSARQALIAVWDDPRLQPGRPGISLRALFRMAGFFLPLFGNLLLNILSPEARRAYIVKKGEQILEQMRERCAAISGDRYSRLAAQARLLQDYADNTLPRTFILFISGVAAGMASFNVLKELAGGLPPQAGELDPAAWDDLVLELTRGLPYNPTTEMDLSLWEVATTIRRDPASLQEFKAFPAAELAERFQAGKAPAAVSQSVSRFLERYGGRGLGEIDLGRPRWLEDPTHVFEVLSGYLSIEDGAQAPDAVFARSEVTSRQAGEQLVAALHRTRGGWIKSGAAKFFIKRIRALMGIRESPKFFAVRMMGILRHELLKTGQKFVRARELEHPDDLMYLTFSELKAFAGREPRPWRDLIGQRREEYRRELLRRQIPRLLLSDGRAFYQGLSGPASEANILSGSPVSPGGVEGRVRVVFDPRRAGLLAGEILVCPGTDPSWTPLFLTAGGLIMEVGGMMTHGAVVAREYGIPAVVGVDQATRRLRTGQRVYLNGSTGQITLLDLDKV